MTIFTASSVSTRKYSIILCTDYSTFNVTHKLLKQVPDSIKHMFRLKITSYLQNQFCKPKVTKSFFLKTYYIKFFYRSTHVFWITNTVSCESPTELNFPQPLGATAFVFTQFNAFFEVFRIVEICLNIGCPRKCNSHSHQFVILH